ncbi:nucleoside deaminase [Ruminococcus flavefaciens]|uniref:CMP/dCMP-type deaminase domain-containing protein n=1 Tax=Ruminococcus flavefaciens 007c TaxID=1341157 RepID=W7UPH5_RUMFL|nr:nucleoside deaminase [Ruminococcus flavefaciens]EWM53349.1 hypothetical protein RF007C_10285 [Ruminococcus flavefaciens 007c]
MWIDISKQWQTAFEEAWDAFCTGSIPIGAAVFDENGELILKDHNRAQLPETVNHRIAHAEANLLRRLDTARFDPRRLTLYTTMEPCPMCMGTASMSNIKHLRSAAHDPHCGMIHLIETEPYFIGKGLDYTFECGDMELVQLTLQSYYELRCMEYGASSCVFDSFREQCPEASEISRRLYENKVLDGAVEEGTAFGVIFDYILSMK